MTTLATQPLSTNLSDLRALCRQQIARGLGFDARELAGVAELLERMEAEAIRLETLEIEAKAFEMAERAVRLLDMYPADVATLEAAMASDKVVIFPGRRAERSGAPS